MTPKQQQAVERVRKALLMHLRFRPDLRRDVLTDLDFLVSELERLDDKLAIKRVQAEATEARVRELEAERDTGGWGGKAEEWRGYP